MKTEEIVKKLEKILNDLNKDHAEIIKEVNSRSDYEFNLSDYYPIMVGRIQADIEMILGKEG